LVVASIARSRGPRRAPGCDRRFLAEPWLLEKTRETLGGIRDVERVLGRLSQGTGNAREMQALAQSLEQLPDLRSHLEALPGAAIRGCSMKSSAICPTFPRSPAACSMPSTRTRRPRSARAGFSAMVSCPNSTNSGAPPPKAASGSPIFRKGKSPPPASSRSRCATTPSSVTSSRSPNRTSISRPTAYTRKQTTVGGERFITPELKEIENKILGADERAKALEYEAYLSLRDEVLVHLEALQAAAAPSPAVDALAGLAETARLFGYVRPI
jgi:DNA mismatch repair protein MutS